jgi:IS30 family transposase
VPDDWERRAGCLGIAEREEFLVGIRSGESLSAMARQIGRSPSTIGREVVANGGREGYSAWGAHHRAREGARRPKRCKLRAGRLCDDVARRLLELWSPDEIARHLPLEFPDDPEMRVSHETIYESLFVQGRSELRRELARCLRPGRTCRKKRGVVDRRGRIPGMVMISDRPAEGPGHWECQWGCQAAGALLGGAIVQARFSRRSAQRTSTRRRARAMTAWL